MKLKRIPEIYRNVQDSSITISYGKPKCSLVWLHGLCDTSEGFYSFFTHSHSPVYDGVRVKLIQAPLRNITINRGQVCHGWYDIMSTNRFTGDEKLAFNFQDIEQSRQIISNHVKDQVKQWQKIEHTSSINPYHRVYVGGFSQGGVMALTYSMQSQVPPAGAICFSGYMLRSVPYTNFMKFPILLAHGSRDPIIREVMAQQSYKKLLTDEGLVEYNSIEGLEHSVELGQLDMMKNWISETFKTIKGVYEKQQKAEQQQNIKKEVKNDSSHKKQ